MAPAPDCNLIGVSKSDTAVLFQGFPILFSAIRAVDSNMKKPEDRPRADVFGNQDDDPGQLCCQWQNFRIEIVIVCDYGFGLIKRAPTLCCPDSLFTMSKPGQPHQKQTEPSRLAPVISWDLHPVCLLLVELSGIEPESTMLPVSFIQQYLK